jgi:hypothetical protein
MRSLFGNVSITESEPAVFAKVFTNVVTANPLKIQASNSARPLRLLGLNWQQMEDAGATLPDIVDVPDLSPQDIADLLVELPRVEPPAFMFVLTGQLQDVGGGVSGSAPGISFSSSRANLDVSAKPVYGDQRGFQLAVSRELTRETLAKRLEKMRRLTQEMIRHLRKNPPDVAKFTSAYKDYKQLVLRVRNAFNTHAIGWQIGVNGAFSRVGARPDNDDHFDFRYANRTTAGLSVGRVIPLGSRPGPGLLTAATIEGVFSDPDQGEYRTGIRSAFRVGILNQVPFVKETGKRAHPYEVRRWRWQSGLEFVPRETPSSGTTTALFFRYRIEPKINDPISWRWVEENSTELGFSIGRGSDGHLFGLFRVSKSFSF